MPFLDKKSVASIAYDLIIVSAQNLPVPAIVNEAKSLGIDTTKLLFDWTTTVYGFSLERYRKLQRSQLSIISRGEFGARLSQLFGLSTPSIGIAASDRDFVNFLRDPWLHVTGEFRSNINWFNALVVMWTEDPKVLAAFDRLPFAKKVCFVPFESTLDSGFQIKPYYVGGRDFESAVNKLASGEEFCFDLWYMLLNETKLPVNLYSRSKSKEILPGQHECITSDGKIRCLNWWGKRNADNFYLTRFIREYVSRDKSFNIFAAFGDRRYVREAKLERKIFFNGEDVFDWPWYDGYQDNCLDSVDLSLNFAEVDAPNYLRFPCWMWSHFAPKLDRTLIENRIAEINAARNTGRYECVLINRHDMMNIRTPIFNQLKDILEIKCAGKWNHNTDELQTVYGDDKLKYVHEFMFNICPENINRHDYVTEKLFDAFLAGSIPIYYGADNNPEPGIVNPSAVLFFDPRGDNEELIKEVRRLKSDDAYYDKFMRQEKLFAKPAAEFIYSTLEELAKRLREMK